MPDSDETRMIVDFIIRLANNPLEAVGEVAEALLTAIAERDRYRAVLEEIGKDPTTRPGWLASEVLREKPPCPT